MEDTESEVLKGGREVKGKQLRYRVWQFVHNCIAHPLEGVVVLFCGQCPGWVSSFHDWTAGMAWKEI